MASEPSDSMERASTDGPPAIDAVTTSEPAVASEPAQTDQDESAYHEESAPATPVIQDTYDMPQEEENVPYVGFGDSEDTEVPRETTGDFIGNPEDSPEGQDDIEALLDPPAEGLQHQVFDMTGGVVENFPNPFPHADEAPYGDDAETTLPELEPSETTDAPVDIDRSFKLPADATIIDLDDYETPEPVDGTVVDSEPKIKEEIQDDNDDNVVMTGSISKLVDLENTMANNQVAATENTEGAADTGISSNSNAPEPTQDDETMEPSSEGQQQRRILPITKAFLKHRKEQDRGLLDKRQQQSVTRAYEALQRKAARENPDLPAYPSPQPVQSEKSDVDMVMDDVTESDTTPPPDAAYIEARKKLERRQKQGSSIIEDDIALKKLEAAENLRIVQFRQRRDFRLRERQELQEQDESLFVEQDTDGGHLGDVNESSDENVGRIPKRPAADDEMYVSSPTQLL